MTTLSWRRSVWPSPAAAVGCPVAGDHGRRLGAGRARGRCRCPGARDLRRRLRRRRYRVRLARRAGSRRAACRARPRRPCLAAVLQRHHRAAQGRDAHPSRPGRQLVPDSRRAPRPRRRRGAGRAAAVPHLRACRSRSTWACAQGATVVTMPRFDLDELPAAGPGLPGDPGRWSSRRSCWPWPGTRPCPTTTCPACA